MMIAFATYRQDSSFLHQLDPRTKLVAVLVYMIATFCAQSILALVLAATLAVAAVGASSMGARVAWAAVHLFRYLIIFVAIINLLFTQSGEIFWDAGMVCISTGGILFAVMVVIRFVSVLLATSTLMYTTSPTALTDGAALVLAPLSRLGLKVNNAALSISMTFRFIPLLLEEYTRVRHAQEARLADFSKKSVIAQARSFVSILVPLFVSALRRSNDLAFAIENRGYREKARRTSVRQYRMRICDWAVLLGVGFLLFLSLV